MWISTIPLILKSFLGHKKVKQKKTRNYYAINCNKNEQDATEKLLRKLRELIKQVK
jgi:hypothetical protein